MSEIEIPQWSLKLKENEVRNRLKFNEDGMIEHLNKVSSHMKDIHDGRLYRLDYGSFEEYLMKRWSMSRARGYQLLQAETVKLALTDAVSDDPEMSKIVDAMPEVQLREISKVPDEDRIKVVKKIAELAPAKMSGPKILEIAAEIGVLPPAKMKPAKGREIHECPECHHKF